MSNSAEEIAAAALAGMETSLSSSHKKPPPDPATAPDEPTKKPRKRRGPKIKFNYPIEPVLIQTVPRRKECVNHSYHDFSNVPAELDYQPPTAIADMTFSQKVHDILSRHEEYGNYICWQPHGRAFLVKVPVMFEKHVCPVYFGHKRYSSFLRQLNNHGFKHISKGIDRNCYYHECFLRGLPHLCKYMPGPKDARRRIPDPENEPNFTTISQMYPLPNANSSGRAAVVQGQAQQDASHNAVAAGSLSSGSSNNDNPSIPTQATESDVMTNSNASTLSLSNGSMMAPALAAAVASNPLFAAALANNPALLVAAAAPNGTNPFFNGASNPTMSVSSSFVTAPQAVHRRGGTSQSLAQQGAGQSFAASLEQQSQRQHSAGTATMADINQLKGILAQQQNRSAPAPPPPRPQPPLTGMDRNSSLAEIRRLQAQLSSSSPAMPPQKTGMDRSTAIAEMNSLQAQLAVHGGATTARGPTSSPQPHQRKGMDRSTAVAEIAQLRARLASELSSTPEQGGNGEPPAKRQQIVVAGSATAPVAQLARMPQPFPRASGISQVEAMLQRDAVVTAIRRHQESREQRQQQQPQGQSGNECSTVEQIQEELRKQQSLQGTQPEVKGLQQLQEQQSHSQQAITEFLRYKSQFGG